jgi:hypothetical protein
MNNPARDVLPMLIRTHFTALTVRDRDRLGTIVTRMLGNRIDADYRPARAIDMSTAVFSLRDAAEALRYMGIL